MLAFSTSKSRRTITNGERHDHLFLFKHIQLSRYTQDVDYAAAEMLAINAGHYVRFAQDKPILR
jgi:hypothetical protein